MNGARGRTSEQGATSLEGRAGVGGEPETRGLPLLRFSLGGLTCDGCTDEIECEMRRMPGVLSARASYDAGMLELILDAREISLAEIEAKLEEMGYPPRLETELPEEVPEGGLEQEVHDHAHLSHEPGRLSHEHAHGLLEPAHAPPAPVHAMHAEAPTHADAHPTHDPSHPNGHADAAHGHDHTAHGHHHHGLACSHPPYREGAEGSSRWVATLGTISGVVCLVHCLATPILLGAVALLPSVGAFMHGTLELILMSVTLVLAWVSVGSSVRVHQRWLPLGLLLLGSVSAIAALLTPEESPLEMVLALGGTALMVSSIWINRALLKRVTYPIQLEPIGADA